MKRGLAASVLTGLEPRLSSHCIPCPLVGGCLPVLLLTSVLRLPLLKRDAKRVEKLRGWLFVTQMLTTMSIYSQVFKFVLLNA